MAYAVFDGNNVCVGLSEVGTVVATAANVGSRWNGYAWRDSPYVDETPVNSIEAGNASFSLLHDNGISRFNTVDVKATGKFVYIDNANGINSRTRAEAMLAATPWKTTKEVYDTALNGDGAYIAAGTYIADGSADYDSDAYHRLGNSTKSLAWLGNGDAILQGNTTTTATALISGLPNNGFMKADGLVIDGRNTTTVALGNNDMTTNVWTVEYTNCTIKNATSQLAQMTGLKAGTFTFDTCNFDGSPSVAGLLGSSAALAASANQTVNVNNCTFNLSYSGTCTGISQDVTGAIANTFTYNITNNSFDISVTGASGSAIAINVKTPKTSITSNTITVNTIDANVSGSYGVLHKSTASVTVTDSLIASNTVNFNSAGGYGISLGDVGGLTITGTIEKNTITGKYYPNNTPHGIVSDRAAIGTVRYNKLSDLYAQILASRSAAGTVISENVTIHGYGADLYAKGCTEATFNKNTCIVTDKYTRRNLGVISVDSQAGVNTVATTMSNNVVLVTTDDLSKIGALVNITNNQTCTYSGNVYVVPDTIPDSTVLFYVGGSEGGRAGATGYTVDQWRAATSISNGTATITVTNERVIKLPLSEILQMVADLGITL